MNKEEILERSRANKVDEGMKKVENDGRQIGFTIFCIVFILEVVVASLYGKDIYGISALFWAFVAAETYPKYKFTKNKVYLVLLIAGAIASLFCFINFVMTIIG